MIFQRVSQACNVFWHQKIILSIQSQRTEVVFGQTLFEAQLSLWPLRFLLEFSEQIDGPCGLEPFSALFNCRDTKSLEEPTLNILEVLTFRCFYENLFLLLPLDKSIVNSWVHISKQAHKKEQLSVLAWCEFEVLLLVSFNLNQEERIFRFLIAFLQFFLLRDR